jgi:D-sedoheptulose 7-phosphate isomerase
MSRGDLLRAGIDEAIIVLERLRMDPAVVAGVEAAAGAVVAALRSGGRVLLCGNGGSAADAQHLAAELVGRFMIDREPWAAIALADNVAALTAIANDYAYEEVFLRGVRAHGRPGDVLVGLSTSGGSANVVCALTAARERGMATIALIGPDRSSVAHAADTVISVDGPSTTRIQEAHQLLGHIIFEIAERELCADG